MLKDYKYLRMAAQNEDPTGSRPPHILVNADRFFLPETTPEEMFHPTSQDGRGDELDSLKDFISRLDPEKTVWRTVAGGGNTASSIAHQRRIGVHLSTSTSSAMINTGIDELAVGDVIYAMPAVAYLAKNNPSVTTFTYRGKLYLHPMILSQEDSVRLQKDIFVAYYDQEDAKTSTVIGGMIKNAIKKHGNEAVDLGKLMQYLIRMRPVGMIEYSLDTHRSSIYNITTTKVAVGSEFICNNNQFG